MNNKAIRYLILTLVVLLTSGCIDSSSWAALDPNPTISEYEPVSITHVNVIFGDDYDRVSYIGKNNQILTIETRYLTKYYSTSMETLIIHNEGKSYATYELYYNPANATGRLK